MRLAAVLAAAAVGATAVAAVTVAQTLPQAAAQVEPVRVCGNVAPGPTTPPAGDTVIVIPPGDLARQNLTFVLRQPNIVAYFEAGVHTIGPDEFAQIQPGSNSTFVGAPGAVLDGQRINRYAFTGQGQNVTVKHLEITGFVSPTDEGVINHDSADGWVIEHNDVHHNRGGAMMAGSHQTVRSNCLRENGQYAMNAAGDSPSNLLVEGNEITGNATDGEPYPGCGCTGGIKFWEVQGATVRNNWVHHNLGVGLWADTNNNDFLIEHNVIEGNTSHAIEWEISYNAVIRNNVIRNNSWGIGRTFANRGDSFPIGTIYVSEAGGEPRLPSRAGGKLEITGNTFVNNWGGVVGWENADRFCGVNTTAHCTLLATTSQCQQPGIASEPLYSDCRWKTQHLDVHHNTFMIDPTVVDGGCDPRFCAESAVFANWGTVPDWSPYKGNVIQEAIAFGQGNSWHDNTYSGPWRFVAYDTGRNLTWDQWRAAPYHQDAGSTFGTAPTSATTTTATTTTVPTTAPTTGPTTTVPTTTKPRPPCR